jgi:superfamily I DNA/RNA helicase
LTNSLSDGDSWQFDHIIVDEYQDLNFLEQNLLNLIADRTGASLCVAGDDDQSIYGFRCANPTGILDFLAQPEVESHEIGVCGRCPRIVLSMANSLIAHAPDREKLPLTCMQGTDGSVALVRWSTQAEEVDGLVAAIASDIQTQRRQPGDVLVLVHRHKIGEAIRDRLRELEVPAHSFFTEESVKSSEAQEALAILRLAVVDDPVSLRVILGIGDSTGRSTGYQRLQEYARAESISEREVLSRAVNGQKSPVSLRAFLPRYRRAFAIIDDLPREDLAAVIDTVLPDDLATVSDLRAIAISALPECDSLEELVDALVVGVTQTDVPPSPDYVRIMSLHKSKGLTSPVVFVAGLVEGVVPTLVSGLSDAKVEAAVVEQRRLLYVALTRASQKLVLSHAASMELALASSMGVEVVRDKIRRVDGMLWAPTIASRYLSELGPDAPNTVAGTRWLKGYGR